MPSAKLLVRSPQITFFPLHSSFLLQGVLVIPKRMGARNLLDLKPDELRDLLATVQKVATTQRKGLGATGFKLIQNNGISSGQTVYHAHFHVVPSFGDGPLGTPAPRKELSPEEYDSIAAKLRAAWPH